MAVDLCNNEAILAVLERLEKRLERRPDEIKTAGFNPQGSIPSAAKPVILDYKDRNYVFAWSPNAIIITVEEYGNVVVAANAWVNLNFPEGTRMYLAGSASQQVLLRWTDYPLPASQPLWVAQTINNAQLSATNPEPNISNIQALILLGQGFTVTTGNQTSGGNGNAETCLFNPANSAKNILIYSIRTQCATAGFSQLSLITADPGLGTSLIPANQKAGSLITSVATAEFTNAVTGISGTVIDSFGMTGNTSVEVLANGAFILLPAGQSSIEGIEVATSTTTNKWSTTIRYVEY